MIRVCTKEGLLLSDGTDGETATTSFGRFNGINVRENQVVRIFGGERRTRPIVAHFARLVESDTFGVAKSKAEVARAMLKEELPLETIYRVTGLTEAQVQSIALSL